MSGHAANWDPDDESFRSRAFATSAGHAEAKRVLEDLFKHLRAIEASGKNGREVRVRRLLHEAIHSPTMQIAERTQVKAPGSVEYRRQALEADRASNRTLNGMIGQKQKTFAGRARASVPCSGEEQHNRPGRYRRLAASGRRRECLASLCARQLQYIGGILAGSHCEVWRMCAATTRWGLQNRLCIARVVPMVQYALGILIPGIQRYAMVLEAGGRVCYESSVCNFEG